ncbi:MAG: replication initiator protein A [Pseudoxanthomonas sp.]|nr:replication initiator protein A [Pseudoxanthomonas sp.]
MTKKDESPGLIQPDLFTLLDAVADWPVKDDIHSMEYPIFSLSKNKDLRIRTYQRGDKYVKIIPSVIGAATVFDKDILIYAVSKIVRAVEAGKTPTRRVRFDIHPFLVGTRRSTGGAAYERALDTCRRLRGTTIETNVKTTEEERTDGFGLVEDYKVTQSTKNGKGALQVELLLSEWLYRAVQEYDILTINPEYFSLAQPMERRLYELGRKHCGDKAFWKINLPLLKEKTGSQQETKYFRRELVKIIKDDALPDYRIAIDEAAKPPQVVYLTRDTRKLSMELAKNNLAGWYGRLVEQGTFPPSSAAKSPAPPPAPALRPRTGGAQPLSELLPGFDVQTQQRGRR